MPARQQARFQQLAAVLAAATSLLARTRAADETPDDTLIPRAQAVAEPGGFTVVEPPEQGAPDALVVSRSGQFRVALGTPAMRASAAVLAEEAKDDFLTLLEAPETGSIPILIHLHRAHPTQQSPPRTRRSAMDLTYGDGGFRLAIHFLVERDIDPARLRQDILAALIIDRSLRGRQPGEEADETRFLAPAWLVEGLSEAIAWAKNRGDAKLYEAAFRKGGLFRLEDLFATTQSERESFDAATRVLFQVSAGALVMALLEQPEGRVAFRALLATVASYDGEFPVLLRRHFPDLNLSEDSLAKWWMLQLASMGTARLTDVLDIPRTEEALEKILVLRVRNDTGFYEEKPLDTWPELAGLSAAERLEAVRLTEDALIRLSLRCFPPYRALLEEYQQVLADLAANRTRRVAERLDNLTKARAGQMSRAERARDYLDYFEITRARETSGSFEDYLNLKSRLADKPYQGKTRIDEYLDLLNGAFTP